MTTIFYDGVNPFSGIAPTPYVKRSVSMIDVNGRWGQAHTYDLTGNITGKCTNFTELVNKQRSLVSNFAKDFKTLEIFDDSKSVFNEPLIRIKDISFDTSNYAYNIPFKIKLESIPQEYFSGCYGVIEPFNEIKFNENKDGVITINQTISAKGINTNSSANNSLINVKNWALSQTGVDSTRAHFITGANYTPELIEQSESFDRLNGKYEIQLSFSTDKYLIGKGLLRFSSDYSYDISAGISTVQIQGNINGSKYSNINDLRDRYKNFDIFSEANNVLYKINGHNDLRGVPLTRSVTEDSANIKLSFSESYNDDVSPLVVFDMKTSFDYNYETDSITAKIDGQIKTNGVFEKRWDSVLNVANQTDLYSLLLPYYVQYLQSLNLSVVDYPLNTVPSSKVRGENENAAEIKLSATYSNSYPVPIGFREFHSSVDVIPSLPQYAVYPCLTSVNVFDVYDLGFNSRSQYSIQVKGAGDDTIAKNDVVDYLKNITMSLRQKYVDGSKVNLESQEIIASNQALNKTVSIRSSYSAEENGFQL